MTSHTMTAEIFGGGDDTVKSYRGWITFAGIALLVTGATALIYDVTATRASVLAFGWLLMLAGAAQIVHAFQVRTWSGFFLHLLDGIIRATVGTLIVVYPGAGAEALTLVLSLYFIVGGTFKTFGSMALRFPSWGWSVASGVLSIVLGIMLAMHWPAASVWFIGFLVGVDLMVHGGALLMFAAAMKKLSPVVLVTEAHMTPATHRRILVIAALLASAAMTAWSPRASAIGSRDKMRQDAARQSAKAAKAFDAIMQVPDKAIPRDLLARASAIAVFPQVVKVAFTVGGEGGRGVVTRRQGDGWGAPVFFRAGGPSFGAQIGASSTDLFLLLMNEESVSGLMKDRFEFGGDVGVAAGPIGRHAGAGTDALLHAAILSYSRSRGVFAGANVKGIVLKPEDELNLAVYNKTAEELLKESPGDDASTESELDAFPRTLRRYTENRLQQ